MCIFCTLHAYIYSELFYGNSLVSMATPGGGDINAILPKEPLAFYGVQGQENKDNLSFSYDNFVEAREVGMLIVMFLLIFTSEFITCFYGNCGY